VNGGRRQQWRAGDGLGSPPLGKPLWKQPEAVVIAAKRSDRSPETQVACSELSSLLCGLNAFPWSKMRDVTMAVASIRVPAVSVPLFWSVEQRAG
jgi:hypothetical protein